MDEEFKLKLRESLEALDKRISAVEHLVNDVIIGGLKDAADSYADDEAYSVFVDTYKPEYEGFSDAGKALYGEDYDFGSDLYERVKGFRDTEGFDEAAKVRELLDEFKSIIDRVKQADSSEVKPNEEEKITDEGEHNEEKPDSDKEIDSNSANEDENIKEFDEDKLKEIFNS